MQSERSSFPNHRKSEVLWYSIMSGTNDHPNRIHNHFFVWSKPNLLTVFIILCFELPQNLCQQAGVQVYLIKWSWGVTWRLLTILIKITSPLISLAPVNRGKFVLSLKFHISSFFPLFSKNTCISGGDSPFYCSVDEAKGVVDEVRKFCFISWIMYCIHDLLHF